MRILYSKANLTIRDRLLYGKKNWLMDKTEDSSGDRLQQFSSLLREKKNRYCPWGWTTRNSCSWAALTRVGNIMCRTFFQFVMKFLPRTGTTLPPTATFLTAMVQHFHIDKCALLMLISVIAAEGFWTANRLSLCCFHFDTVAMWPWTFNANYTSQLNQRHPQEHCPHWGCCWVPQGEGLWQELNHWCCVWLAAGFRWVSGVWSEAGRVYKTTIPDVD
jgi:hypothetical protein